VLNAILRRLVGSTARAGIDDLAGIWWFQAGEPGKIQGGAPPSDVNVGL